MLNGIRSGYRRQQVGFSSSISGVRRLLESDHISKAEAEAIVNFVREAGNDGQDLHFHFTSFFSDALSHSTKAIVQKGAKTVEQIANALKDGGKSLEKGIFASVDTFENFRDIKIGSDINLRAIQEIVRRRGPFEIRNAEFAEKPVQLPYVKFEADRAAKAKFLEKNSDGIF